MRWFRIKTYRRTRSEKQWNDKAASSIAGWMLSVQNKFAMTMNKQYSKLSTAKRKASVVFFCLIGGGLSTYYIGEAIVGARKENPVEKIGSFQIPKHDRETEAQSLEIIDDGTWRQIVLFKRYMDSLKVNDNAEYLRVMKLRPGLMDSINALEQIYYSQKIK